MGLVHGITTNDDIDQQWNRLQVRYGHIFRERAMLQHRAKYADIISNVNLEP